MDGDQDGARSPAPGALVAVSLTTVSRRQPYGACVCRSPARKSISTPSKTSLSRSMFLSGSASECLWPLATSAGFAAAAGLRDGRPALGSAGSAGLAFGSIAVRSAAGLSPMRGKASSQARTTITETTRIDIAAITPWRFTATVPRKRRTSEATECSREV